MEEFTRMPVHRVAEIVATTNEVGMPGLCASDAVLRMLACSAGLLWGSRTGSCTALQRCLCGREELDSQWRMGCLLPHCAVDTCAPLCRGYLCRLRPPSRSCIRSATAFPFPCHPSCRMYCTVQGELRPSHHRLVHPTRLHHPRHAWLSGAAAGAAQRRLQLIRVQRQQRRQQRRQLHSRFISGRGQLSCCGDCS